MVDATKDENNAEINENAQVTRKKTSVRRRSPTSKSNNSKLVETIKNNITESLTVENAEEKTSIKKSPVRKAATKKASPETTLNNEKKETSKKKNIEDVLDEMLDVSSLPTAKAVPARKTAKKKSAAQTKSAITSEVAKDLKISTSETIDNKSIASNSKGKKNKSISDTKNKPKGSRKNINDVLDDLLNVDSVAIINETNISSSKNTISDSFSDNVLKVAQTTLLKPSKGESLENYLQSANDYYRLMYPKLKALVNKNDLAVYTRENVCSEVVRLISNKELVAIKTCHNYALMPRDSIEVVEGVIEFSYEFDKLKKTSGMDPYTYKTEFLNDDKEHFTLYTTDSTVFHGDRVKGVLNKNLGVVYYQETIKEHNLILGRILKHNNGFNLVPDDPKFGRQRFIFPKVSSIGEATLGSIVICSILKRRENGDFLVEVKEILGDFERLDVQIKIAITKNGIPYEWNEKVEKQVNNIPDEVTQQDWQGRVDLRKLPLVTIDGEDARDFDDAVYCRKEGSGYKLFVAIADVSYYVRPTSPLDHEAIMRGTSVYFPNYVVPMLPEKLSNGLCSLNPFVDRLCMVCEVNVDKNGELGEYNFYPAVMNSHARLTYTEVASVLAGNEPSAPEVKELIPDLHNLYNLYSCLKKARNNRGAIEFESEEVRFVFDEDLNISDVLPVVRNDAHMLIEECMIAANVCAAKFVEAKKGATLYRVHDKPSELKLQAFRSFLAPFGLSLGGGDEPTSKDYAKFALAVKDNPNAKALLMMMLRSMSLAQYTPENSGHFGLALGNYAHFTSPIRRYPDLQLHREIKYLLGKGESFTAKDMKNIGAKQYLDEELETLAESCNNTERRADKVTGEVSAVLKAKFMEKFIGQSLSGIISNVTSFGLFVSIDRFHIDGMVHVANLGNDFFRFDEEKCSLIGDRTRFIFKVGDKIDVIIDSVDTESGHINMTPCNLPAKLESSNSKKKSKTKVGPEFTPIPAIPNTEVNTIIRGVMNKWDSVTDDGNASRDGDKPNKKKNKKKFHKDDLEVAENKKKKSKKKKANSKNKHKKDE